MISFHTLRKNCKKYPVDGKLAKKVALLGDCATQLLAVAVRGYGIEYGFNLEVLDTDYNQIEPQTMDEQSELYAFDAEYTLIAMCTEKMYEAYCACESTDRFSFAATQAERICGYWERICHYSKARILQFNFPEVDDHVFGNYANKVESSFLYQIRKLNILLMEQAAQYKNVYLVDCQSVQNELGRVRFFDEKYYYSAKAPYSLEAMAYLAKNVLDIIQALSGKMKKCVVLDLDNTLWGGVVGDDGLQGIQIGELGTGHAFTDFQLWLRELQKRGILLAVCSKNNEDAAKEPFLKHPDMVLKMDDISMFVANWDDKASNIRYIQQTLNLGMDSLVFIDDNPFERNLVKSLIPEIVVPELPEDPAQYLRFLQNLNLFEAPSYSEEDTKRTKQYQEEIGRMTLKKQFASIDEYLQGLEMVAEVKPFEPFQYPRISQLTQRSNQFNLRTVRYTEAEIEQRAKDEHYLTLYFTLRDKLGDHGLISVVIMEKQTENTLFLDTWLMSCRVLKRGMEEFIANNMIETARENGYRYVVGEYIKTPKNAMVEHIYSRLGFSEIEGKPGFYIADVETFQSNKTYIKEEIE